VDKWTWKDKFLLAIVPLFGSLALRLLSLTIRKKTLYPERFQKSRDQGQPVTYGASGKRSLNTWDHFIIPLPFCRVVFIWGDPVWVPRDSKREEMEEKRLLLQDRLRRITEEADRFFKKTKEAR
jgi:lysophospholipid acyltransferase (LPLAT)-like uncharacterized protein